MQTWVYEGEVDIALNDEKYARDNDRELRIMSSCKKINPAMGKPDLISRFPERLDMRVREQKYRFSTQPVGRQILSYPGQSHNNDPLHPVPIG